MSIITFLKNRYKKTLINKIHRLKVHSAREYQAAESAKECSFKTSSYISLRQELAASGDIGSKIHLSCHLHEHLRKLKSYERNYAVAHQRYLNIQDQISILEKELKNL